MRCQFDGYCQRTNPGEGSAPVKSATKAAFPSGAGCIWRRPRHANVPLVLRECLYGTLVASPLFLIHGQVGVPIPDPIPNVVHALT